jgi:hypothetical protein
MSIRHLLNGLDQAVRVLWAKLTPGSESLEIPDITEREISRPAEPADFPAVSVNGLPKERVRQEGIF